jgi:hypothetical protein
MRRLRFQKVPLRHIITMALCPHAPERRSPPGSSLAEIIASRTVAAPSRANRDQNQAIREWVTENGYEVFAGARSSRGAAWCRS